MAENGGRKMRFADIAVEAFEHWQTFTDEDPKHTPDDLLQPGSRDLNGAALDFFLHCLRAKDFPAHGLREGYVVPKDLSPNEPNPEKKPVSWLLTKEDQPLIAVDTTYLTDTTLKVRRRRALTAIILHETGHFVRHWSELTKQAEMAAEEPAVPDGVAESSEEQEEEGWWYALCVLAAAIGQKAREDRKAGGYEQAWRDI